jgi:hypothetical protein
LGVKEATITIFVHDIERSNLVVASTEFETTLVVPSVQPFSTQLPSISKKELDLNQLAYWGEEDEI